MRHDLDLAAVGRPPSPRAYVGMALATLCGRRGYWNAIGAGVALLAFGLVPGRFVVVLAWPAAAALLGFAS